MYGFTVVDCQECGSKFSDSDGLNQHSRNVHSASGCRVKFYYLVRHVKSTQTTNYPATRQIVYHSKTENDVEEHLERIQKAVQMPKGCTYSIEHF